jgi:hypothetical protein
VNIIAAVVSPLGISLTFLAKKTLQLMGFDQDKDKNGGVSDSELRLIVTGARDSGAIDHGEQEMIQGVLNSRRPTRQGNYETPCRNYCRPPYHVRGIGARCRTGIRILTYPRIRWRD